MQVALVYTATKQRPLEARIWTSVGATEFGSAASNGACGANFRPLPSSGGGDSGRFLGGLLPEFVADLVL